MMKQRHLFLALIALFLMPPLAVACDCERNEEDSKTLFRYVDAISLGKVTHVSELQTRNSLNRPLRGIHFSVKKIWKFPGVHVLTQDPSNSCDDYPFQVGRSYIVYAKKEGKDFKLPPCAVVVPVDETTLSQQALKHLAFLNSPIPSSKILAWGGPGFDKKRTAAGQLLSSTRYRLVRNTDQAGETGELDLFIDDERTAFTSIALSINNKIEVTRCGKAERHINAAMVCGFNQQLLKDLRGKVPFQIIERDKKTVLLSDTLDLDEFRRQ